MKPTRLEELNQMSLFDKDNNPIDVDTLQQIERITPDQFQSEDEPIACDYEGIWNGIPDESPAKNEHFQNILRTGRMMNTFMKAPKHNCKECHGKGYTRMESVPRLKKSPDDKQTYYDSPVICTCIYTREQVEADYKKTRKVSREERRKAGRDIRQIKNTITAYENGLSPKKKVTSSKKKMIKASKRANRK